LQVAERLITICTFNKVTRL